MKYTVRVIELLATPMVYTVSATNEGDARDYAMDGKYLDAQAERQSYIVSREIQACEPEYPAMTLQRLHELFPIHEWRKAVSDEATTLGYAQWTDAKRETGEAQKRHLENLRIAVRQYKEDEV